ncbi:molybdopterin-guanine dinucleotide biosynthesis protein B [Halobacillus karajensis]|uniref:Molybdopterin-guanine dinucleotide biosynthesis protein B n=1 Tax=Halobacillus karajensis TaxID=195088 RepID=A0A024P7S2_9BACI|nr:molybdopterin-guanine dinucleotide biosynthesis protein B [Halobacillus karajensis]CDQ21043.1 Molybdopterin-guanine dinucleotide biosynthesis protein B [Halobacillus karajensis]CDQ24893.1 Molybdopterin-guanine dinucleotide biosynthesis protein B [Halobacillus karajensis]CDQ28747.1 Molybdopterin-guanine dinucleotide biosynthesis protein B [Halobacillus karajensis]SEH97036.1 molybdopterin-guanine dinucleotide biosynthesis protein B [Halobacillus karajensis]
MTEAPVFQIVGYKNSGKTSLLSDLIAYGTERGEKVAAIKHHRHEEPLKVMHDDTDSYRLHESGAFLTGVDSPRRFQLELTHEEDFPLKQLVSIYQSFSPDLITIEGYKKEDFPKAVIIKRKEDLLLLDQLMNIQLVICWDEHMTEQISLPVIALKDWRKHLPEVYKKAKERT